MIYFTLLNNKETTPLILRELREQCGIHVKIMDREVTTHIQLGTRYSSMILTNEWDGSVLHIYAKAIEDKTHLTINLKNINSILEIS